MHRAALNRGRDFDRWPALDAGQWLDFNPTLVELPPSQGGGRLAIIRRDRCPPQPGRGTLWTLRVDDALRPVSAPRPLVGRGEDPRAVVIGDRLLVFYCVIDRDERDAVSGSTMVLAEFDLQHGEPVLRRQFALPKNPLKLLRPEDRHAAWEKNWVPFVIDEGRVGLVYSHDPWHVIELSVAADSDERRFVGHHSGPALKWRHGHVRGGTTPLPWGPDRWISFFHASEVVGSRKMYTVGACTFDRQAPFAPRSITREPLVVAPYHSGAHRFGWAFAGSVVFPLGAMATPQGHRLLCGLDDGEIGSFDIRSGELQERLDPIDAEAAPPWRDGDESTWAPNGPVLTAVENGSLPRARFLAQLLGQGRCFVDWGAGDGVASVLLAAGFDRVQAYDEQPARRRALQRLALVNGLAAVEVEPPPQRLDDCALGAVDLLRIDQPQQLPAVLDGAQALVERCRPVLFVHLHSDEAQAQAAVAWLEARGYDTRRLAVHHPNWLVALPSERRAAWSWWF